MNNNILEKERFLYLVSHAPSNQRNNGLWLRDQKIKNHDIAATVTFSFHIHDSIVCHKSFYPWCIDETLKRAEQFFEKYKDENRVFYLAYFDWDSAKDRADPARVARIKENFIIKTHDEILAEGDLLMRCKYH